MYQSPNKNQHKKTAMRKIYKYLVLLLVLVFAAGAQAIQAQVISNATPNSTYTEHVPPIVLHPNFTVTGGSAYGGGYLLFDLTNGSLGDQLGINSDANPNALGAISVSGTGVFLGNGSGTTIIGSIDGVLNGLNGQKLKINFTSNFANPSFESGLTGWTVGNSQIKLGSTQLLGFTMPSDPTNPSNTSAGDTHVPLSATYTSSVSTTEHSQGTNSLWLFSNMTTSAGCDVVHGPYAYSAAFQSNAGDILSFDWRALGGNDAYDVFCYILNVNTGVSTICLNQTGANASAATPWATASISVPTTGTYRFVFVSGTWDQTCGQAAGASLYVDNVKVFGDNVTPEIISAIAKRVTYQNNCGTSAVTRNLTITLSKQDLSTTSTSSTINIVTNPPVAIAQDLTVFLAANGQVTVSPTSVNNGSTDDCSMTFTLNKTVFNCTNVGANPVVLTVKDTYGNTSTANATIYVVDNTPPSIVCPANITVNNTPGQCGAIVNFAASVSDNCGYVLNYNRAPGSFFQRGVTQVTATANDPSGNFVTCSFTVTVLDNEKPVPTLANLPTITGQCSAGIPAPPTATDNCSGLITGTTSSPVSYSTQGTYNVTWTYNDGNGNVQTQTQTVIVKDNIAPATPVLATVNGECTATATAPSTTDNCAGTVQGTTSDATTYTTQGTYTIHWTFSDGNGNSTTANQFVIVKDVTAPMISCPHSVTVNNATNVCGATVTYARPTATDNCSTTGFNFFNTGEPNNSGGEDFIELFTNGTWNDNPGFAALRFIVEFNTINTTPISGYALIGTFEGHTYFMSNASLSWPNARTAAISIGGDLVSINTYDEDIFLAPYGGHTWVGGYQDHSDPSYVEPGNGSQNYGGWKWTDGTKLGGGRMTITQIAGLPSGSVFPVGVTTNTYQATDEVGNSSTCSFTVTVIDNQKPTITCAANVNHAADANVCSYSFVPTTPLTSDNCPGTTVAGVRSDAQALNAPYPVGTTTITWTATDASNNKSTCTQTVTVTDNQNPIFVTFPVNITVNALANNCASIVMWTKPTASDNCGVASIVSSDPFFDAVGYSFLSVGVNTITYTVTDVNGNQSVRSFTVTVVDNQAPFITLCPGNITVNAADGLCSSVVNWNPPTASDNCPGVSLSTNHISGETFNVGTTVVTYTATDHSGLVTTCSFNVTVVDNQLPVITCPASISVANNAGQCGATVAIVAATATDNCPGVTVTGVRSDALSLGAAYPVGTTTITWTATDAHNNTATCTQTIVVTDTENPVITCGAPITHTANAGLCSYSFIPTAPAASDNCPGVTVTGVRNDGQALTAAYPVGTTTITWTATDAHAHSVTCTQTVTITDDENPVMACPANISHTADAGVCSYSFTPVTPTATDNCPGVTVAGVRNDGQPLNAAYPSGVTTITWTATDAHAHTLVCTQTITVTDNEKPTIVCATAQTVNLDANCSAVLPDFRNLLSVNDNCTPAGSLVVTQSPVAGTVLNSTGTITVVFTVTDASGNSNTCSIVVTKKDVTPPTIVCVAPLTVNNDQNVCGAVVTYVAPTATDNCTVATVGSQSFAYTGSIINFTVPAGVTSLDIRATGARGGGNGGFGANMFGTVTVTPGQVIKVLVGQAGVYDGSRAGGGGGSFVVSSTNAPLVIAGGGGGQGVFASSAGDNGQLGINGSTKGQSTGGINGNGGSVGAFGQNGGCGDPGNGGGGLLTNGGGDASSGGRAFINGGGAGVDGTVNCIVSPKGGFGGGGAGGNGGGGGGGYSGGSGGDNGGVYFGGGGGGSFNAGTNQSNTIGNLTNGQVTIAWNGTGAVPVVQTAGLPSGSTFPVGTTTNTFVATDASGNTSTCSFTVLVKDTQAPVLVGVPANATAECDAVPAAPTVTATDNCSTSIPTFTETRTNGNCASNYTLTRTWSTTDASGNNTTRSQVITVRDTKAPVLSAAPADITVECNAVPGAAVLTASDNCDAAPAVSYIEVRTNGSSTNDYTLTRTWTATDACGNTSSKTQIITVRDTQAPVISAAPADVTVECDAVPAAVILTATDNCDAPVVTYAEVRTNGNCPSNYILTRTWTATDVSGNTSSKTQIVTVQDTQAPVLSAAPADVTVECDAVPAAATLTATDNCDAPTVTYAEVRTNGNCPSNYILTRTWTAVDACGNTSSKTQTITVQDTQAPVLSAAPADVTVECDAVPTAATLTATDNCDTPTVTYAEVRTNGNCPSNYILTRTWTAVDACGNTSSKTQTITVQDTQAPVLSAAPADVTVECNAVPAAATLTATDNCDTPTVTYAEVRTNGNCPSNYILTRTWTAVDACGNTSSKTQTITVQDTQAPVLSAAPADVTVECDAVPTAATLTATDNCDTPTVTYAEVRTNGNCPSNYTLTRTWTAVDACGNTSSKTQTITVQDTQAPVLSAAPADVTVECNAVPAAATLTATDNCDAPTVTYTEVRTNGNCPSSYTLTRTWTAVDACGNTSSKTQTITVQDTQAPVLSAAPADVTVECDAVPAAAILTATDNCDAPVVVYHESRTNGNSPSNYTLTRTWTVTDACGNTSSAAQTITVRDTKKPVLSAAPANVTVECNAVPAAATLTATDNCDATPAVTYNETRTNGNCPGNYTLTRTWTATDASGNTCSKTQTITVQDTQKPVLSAAPASVTVACNAVPAAAILTATDNCDAPAVTYSEVRTNGSSPFNYTLTRTWTATDACGNSCSKTQVITVRDTQAPVPTIAVLPTLTGDCSVTASAPTAQDNCAGLITATTVNPASYTAQGVYTITWSYNDGQGNTSTQTQRVVVKDQSGPIANAGALPTVTGQCSAVVTTKPTATDACSSVTAPGTTTDPLSYSAQGTYTIHWTYTDNFGNKTYQDQTVIVKDNIAPVPNLASLPTIEGQCSVNITMVNSTHCTDNCYCCRNVCHCRSSACNCNQWGEWLSNIFAYFFGNGNTGDDNHGCDHDEEVDDVNNLKMQAPTATDNCKGTIVGTTTDPLSYSTQGTYTIHWSFNDGNGNISIQNQTVTVADVEAPVPNAYSLPTVYGTCSATVTAKPTAKDNCKGTITGTTTDPLTYAGNGTYVIHWTFNDGNGNTSAQNQTVVINDNTKPTLTEPNDITISCSSSTLPAVTGNATASDNCGTPTITYTDATNGNKITRTWKATDAAGNYVTDVQVITISDNTKPVITAPSNTTVACGTSTLPAATGTATATDNCSTATITYNDNTNGYVTTRTWKATDAAGNYSTATQIITVVDNVKPLITAPNNVTVNCGSSTSPNATGTASGSDACSNVSISYSDASANSVITRTWKATDASGNFITATQTITIVDNTKPVISDVNDITISCSQSSTPAGCNSVATATDNCSTPTVTYSDVTAGNKITRTWKATDAAGNFATSTQVITIVDNTKPVLTEPNDITINCGASTLPAVTGNATATDNCSTPAITYSDATNGNVITRTWKATDASGNYVTDVQLITIGSSFSAALTSVPTNNTYTGGVNTNLYLGFGAQSTTLQMCNLPSSGAPYSYAWSGTASNKLNSTTTASPVFTPATFGYYSFTVVVTNKYGCTSSAYISICVTDVRVPGTSGAKVYVCHTPGGKNKTPQTLQVAISQVSSHIGSSSCGSNGDDRLGSCDESPCNTTVTNSTIVSNSTTVTKEGSETVATTEEDLKVTVMPNPTTTFFTLKLESKYETPVSMRVMDARGRVIDAKSKIGANSTIQIGHNYSSGTYYAEFIQGSKRKVVQMIKSRG
jgi:hypothetical protein